MFSPLNGLKLIITIKCHIMMYTVLMRTYGTKRNEMTGVWRKVHNEELHSLYSSPKG
jgi:hypothetical protein